MQILGNRLLIQPTIPIDRLESGLYLPQTAVQKPNTGKIVLVGNGASESWQGKTVMYSSISAVHISGMHLIHETDIRFIL